MDISVSEAQADMRQGYCSGGAGIFHGGNMRLLLALCAILISLPSYAVEISNFTAGLACTNPMPAKGENGWICHQTHDIFITDHGRCVYDGATMPCTWFGFEFDYEAAEETTELQCLSETSEPTSSGNPGEVVARNRKSHPYVLELTGKSGHFFNPMYYIFAVRPPTSSKIVSTYTCKVGGVTLFQASFNMHFPVVAE